ncbi:MAG: response regulator [Woeseiaceae bacterium]
MSKTALIVDDSRSARVVLKNMLEAHELEVDSAESAEDALDYLNDHRPDVIFMDHMMPGMDGFEAVSAIKNNPDTATIPIMMYTSQEGELYVGQARALGAVGVLPKQIEPVEVSKVLESLRVIGGDHGLEQTESPDTAATEVSGEFPALEMLDQDLRLLIQNLFNQQRAVLRRDLLDSYETIAARVVDEIRPPEKPVDVEVETVDKEEPSQILLGSIAILTVVSMVFAWLYWQREQSWQALQGQYAQVQQELEELRDSDANSTLQASQQFDNYEATIDTMYLSTLASLEWGANQGSLYAFDELPMGDARLAVLEQLDDRLAALNFSGVVRIESHVANFCMSASGPDGYQLAPGDAPAASCDQIGLASIEAYEFGLRQSVAFANFIRLADVRSGGKIRYEIMSLGNADPVMAYPAAAEGMSASDWNRIAAANNRVQLSIFADNF